MATKGVHAEGQQHPIKLYLVVWGWLFVLSTGSYLVDYFGLQGYLRWSLILVLMVLKAGLIVAVFMHMAWERLALLYAILLPPGAVLVFLGIMAFESDYTFFTRTKFFAGASAGTETTEYQTGRSVGAKTSGPAEIAVSLSNQLEQQAGTPGLGVAKAEPEPKEAQSKATASGNSEGVASVQNHIAPTSKAPEPKFYTVKLGDTLWKIAEVVYGRGNGGKYHLIVEANRPLQFHPNKLHPGRVLRIPQPGPEHLVGTTGMIGASD